MNNILYLDDYINLYSNKLKKIIVEKPYKYTLCNGRVINAEKFRKKFIKIKDNYKLNNNLLNDNILVIINSSIKDVDKSILKEVLEELNYKKIEFINELDIIRLNKNNIFINYNESYFNIYQVEHNGNIKSSLYDNNYVNRKLILKIIELLSIKEVIFTGKNYKELLNLLRESKYNYYYFEENDNLLIKKYIENKNV